jgi:hypothetical protein
MASTVFTQQIAPTEYIGDSLSKINSNYSNLQTAACDLSGKLSGVISLAVQQAQGGVNVNVTPVSGSGNITLYPNKCPEWHVGSTGVALQHEVGANRISQQLTLSANYFKHIRDINTYNPPMPSTVYVEEVGDPINAMTEGGVMMADGNIYCVKSNYTLNNTNAAIYDYKANKTFNTGSYPASNIWSSAGALMSDGRILLFPTGAYAAQIYNPNTNSMQTAGGTHWTGSGAFYSGTVLFDGRVYVNAANAGVPCVIYDPRTDSTTATPTATYASGSCALLPDGKVYRVPGYYTPQPAGTIRGQIYNPDTNTWAVAPGIFPTTARGFHLMRLLPNGKYFIAPNDSGCGGGRIFDPYASSDENALIPTTTSKWYANTFVDLFYGGAALLPDGRLFLAPWTANKAIIYDYVNDTTEEVTVPLHSTGYGYYSGAFTLPNGKVIAIPYAGRKPILISTYNQKSYSLAALTGPHFNRTY